MGIDLSEADLDPGGQSGVWPDNVPAVRAFLSVATQWRWIAGWDGRLATTGLDYAGVRAGLRLAGIAITPRLWDEVQVIEHAAVAALNEDRR